MSTKTREKKSVAKIVGFVLLGILVLVAAISGFLLTHYSGLLGDLREEERGNAIAETAEANAGEQIVAPTSIADDVFTILLVGVDSYQDTYTGRSDVQMLMSINQKNKKVVLCSILRDSYVSIPGHGNNRINAAYGEGGTNLLTQTIKNNFGIPVNRVAVINFKVVVDFVDAIGGVDVDLSPEEVEIINNGASGYLNGAGVNHLNGDQALTYARIRKIDNDFSRTKRQRVVMEDALEKIGNMSLAQQSSLMTEFLPRVHTDLTRSEVINLGSLVLRLKSFQVNSFAIPVDGSWSDMTVRGMAVLDIDFAANRKAWEDAVS
ncbi:MAG: LCP family protein [Clostridia bacterium]|nr:LCP family protein [Clostridia bacterium]MBR1827673.1 LCP family protein [Clostridia bacterium]